MTGIGILSYGTHVPVHRLPRESIPDAVRLGGRGTRTVAGSDEDATTMAVAASRDALRAVPRDAELESVWLATTSPPYEDKTNASALHAALGLNGAVGAYDIVGSVRGAAAALRAGTAGPTSLVALSDLRSGLPGSNDERDGGDAAAAFVLGRGPVLAELVGRGSTTAEFLDRWRTRGDFAARTWEDRFGEQVYLPLGVEAAEAAGADASMAFADAQHVIITGVHPRASTALAKALGVTRDALVDDLSASVGNAGVAQPGLLLAAALDRAEPGDLVALVLLAHGADAFVFRCTRELAAWRDRRGVPTVRAPVEVDYTTYLLWRGLLRSEPPRRPEPDVPVAPASFRDQAWKFAFRGSRCDTCDTVHLPPQRICGSCHAVDAMTPHVVVDAVGTIVTVTADHLAYTPDPPLVVAIVDFDGGGRVQCEMTESVNRSPLIGDRVEMAFRRAYTSGGVHNYVWKARPFREESDHG